MVWQDVFPLSVSRKDAEEERELRLAAQARAGADWALAALVARYQPPVTRYLTRLTGNPALARTLAERIFVRMARRVRGPQGGQRLRLWVLRACTEAGLDAVRQPHDSHTAARLEGPRPTALLTTGQTAVSASEKLRAGLDVLANLTGTTSRQMRKLIWSTADGDGATRTARVASGKQSPAKAEMLQSVEMSQSVEEVEQLDAREALRYRMVRAVLAELPYGDAQCLALHLVAGLNQAEVAYALGITHSATRKRIVHGLQLFAQRYEAAAASLGLPVDAFTPGTDSPVAAASALHRGDDIEDEFDVADQPTVDLRRPTIVTGTLAAVSPVIRSADAPDTSHATKEQPAWDGTGETRETRETGETAQAAAAAAVPVPVPVPTEPVYVYPAVDEVVAVPVIETPPDGREKPFMVALIAEAVEVQVNPPEPAQNVLPAPALPEPVAARLVPVLTATEGEDTALVDNEQPGYEPAPTPQLLVRTVPVLTTTAIASTPAAPPANTPAASESDSDVPRGTPEAAPEATPGGEAPTTMSAVVRLVPVVTPVARAETAGPRFAPNEDSIATKPLRGKQDNSRGNGAYGQRNGATGGARDEAGDMHMAYEPENTAEGAPLAIAAIASDDAGANN